MQMRQPVARVHLRQLMLVLLANYIRAGYFRLSYLTSTHHALMQVVTDTAVGKLFSVGLGLRDAVIIFVSRRS